MISIIARTLNVACDYTLCLCIERNFVWDSKWGRDRARERDRRARRCPADDALPMPQAAEDHYLLDSIRCHFSSPAPALSSLLYRSACNFVHQLSQRYHIRQLSLNSSKPGVFASLGLFLCELARSVLLLDIILVEWSSQQRSVSC